MCLEKSLRTFYSDCSFLPASEPQKDLSGGVPGGKTHDIVESPLIMHSLVVFLFHTQCEMTKLIKFIKMTFKGSAAGKQISYVALF